MKKIVLALLVCFMFAGAGFCAPHKSKAPTTAVVAARPAGHHAAPPPPAKRPHRHHPYRYNAYYYPYGTSVTVRTNGVSFSYGIGNGPGLSTVWY